MKPRFFSRVCKYEDGELADSTNQFTIGKEAMKNTFNFCRVLLFYSTF
jgi:hypothetical protein